MRPFCRRLTALTLAVLLCAGGFTALPGRAEETAAAAAEAFSAFTAVVTDFSRSGNLKLDLRASELKDAGYEPGAVLTVTVAGQALEMPLCSSYNDVPAGSPAAVLIINPAEDRDQVVLAVNSGNMAETLGIAVRLETEEEPGYRWEVLTDTPIPVTLAMKDPAGYLSEMSLRTLEISYDRASAPGLTDEEWANFRRVGTQGMGQGVLYRSTSPLDPGMARNAEAAAALERHGIASILNLADTPAEMRAYAAYPDSYYARRDAIAVSMTVDCLKPENGAKLAEGLRFLIAHDGPYLIHCTGGKDRTGFVCAVLECLMGATAEEVIADYMATYRNLYGVEPGTERSERIARDTIVPLLCEALATADLRTADLRAAAEGYLLRIGLTEAEIAQLRARLSVRFDPE